MTKGSDSTGPSTDGAVFARYGSRDVALIWPLRYLHSPAEVIDTKDLEVTGKEFPPYGLLPAQSHKKMPSLSRGHLLPLCITNVQQLFLY